MDRVSEIHQTNIQHRLNSGKESYIKGFFVDGIFENQVFEFYSCYFHGCPVCFEREMTNKSPAWKNQQRKRLKQIN